MFMDFIQPSHIGEMPPVFVVQPFYDSQTQTRRCWSFTSCLCWSNCPKKSPNQMFPSFSNETWRSFYLFTYLLSWIIIFHYLYHCQKKPWKRSARWICDVTAFGSRTKWLTSKSRTCGWNEQRVARRCSCSLRHILCLALVCFTCHLFPSDFPETAFSTLF